MASLQDIQLKIKAVKQTQKITKAMNMVAAAKLRQVQGRTEAFQPYASKFGEVMESLASRIEADIHPLLVQPESVQKIGLIAFASDRGLCGSFNTNAISQVENFLKEKTAEDLDVEMTLVSRKMQLYFKRRPVNVKNSYSTYMSSFDYVTASGLARDAMDSFMQGEVQEVWIAYTRFESMAKQTAVIQKLLPISAGEQEEEEALGAEYICEPSIEGMMIDLLPKSVTIQVYNAMLQTSTSEYAARMAAMDNATKNCKELVTDLTLVYNKARQSAVTAELLDIVCGAEALKNA